MAVMYQSLVRDLGHLDTAEYRTVILNNLNEEGWQLVNVVSNFAYLVRINPEWIAEQELLEKRRLSNMRRR